MLPIASLDRLGRGIQGYLQFCYLSLANITFYHHSKTQRVLSFRQKREFSSQCEKLYCLLTVQFTLLTVL